jgi:hypothetical protein
MARKSTSKSKLPKAISLLIADHRRVQKMFKQFEKLDPSDSDARALVDKACLELTAHTRLEEELFYPALRGQIESDLLEEAQVEHDVAKDLIEQLKKLSPDDERYCAAFTVLGEYVGHHIEEEEAEMFKAAKRSKVDFDDLALEMQERKHKLAQELGLEEDASAADESSGRGSRRARPAARA